MIDGRGVAGARTGRFRPDIEGLRAIAVLSVLGYHAGLDVLAGGYVGVDVFFVISGFLITGHLLREIESSGTIRFGDFYARRARRLLPAALATLIGTALLTVLVLPASRWRDIAGDVVASATYLVNWRLADRAVDYLALEEAASPVQHFWSLAVEEQFYLVWPVLLLVAVVGGRRAGWSARRSLVVSMTLVAVPSLVWAIHLTATEPGRAYFVSTTRIWEMALGGLVVVLGPWLLRVAPQWRVAIGWTGVAAIVLAATTFDATTSFPGPAALLPTLGTAAVIAAGVAGEGRLQRWLGTRPAQAVGARSYALYLWHWPLVVVASASGPMSDGVGVAVVTASFLPAWVSHRYVEEPFRRRGVVAPSGRRGVVLAVACTAGGVVAGLALLAAVPTAAPPGPAPVAVDLAALADGVVDDEAVQIVPDPVLAADDIPTGYDDECHSHGGQTAVAVCLDDVPSPTLDVALVGDSHALQWQPAFQELARQRRWRLSTITRAACPFADDVQIVDRADAVDEACTTWNRNLADRLVGDDLPDVVFLSNTHNYRLLGEDGPMSRPDSREVLGPAIRRTATTLVERGAVVVILRDTPRLVESPVECVERNLASLSVCARPRTEAMDGNTIHLASRQQEPRAAIIDLTDAMCGPVMCPVVIDGIMVYRDNNHLTATFVKSLVPLLGERFDAVLAS